MNKTTLIVFTILFASFLLSNVSASDSNPLGLVDPINGPAIVGQGWGVDNTVHGWACDPDWQSRGQSIDVQIYIDGPVSTGTFAASVISNQPSEAAVASACGSSNANQRFSWAIPQKYWDGKTHQIYVYAMGKDSSGNYNGINILAAQSPQSFTINAPYVSPTFVSYSIGTSAITENSNITVSGLANAGSSCITQHRFYVVGSQGGVWTNVGCQQSVSLSASHNTSSNPLSFYKNPSAYTLRWEIQDSTGAIVSRDISLTVNPEPSQVVNTPVCSSFSYSSFGTCVAGTQTRFVTSSSPSGCSGGTPQTAQSCIDITPPSAVSNLNVAPGANSAILSWTNPSDSDFSKVIIYLNNVNVANSSGSPFTLNGLSPSTAYNVSAKTVDSSGNINSNMINLSFVTLASGSPGADITPPGTVSGISVVSYGSTFIVWNWTNPSDSDFQSNIIYINGVNVLNTSASSFTSTGLSSGAIYTININTKDSSGNVNSTVESYVFATSSTQSGGSSSSSSSSSGSSKTQNIRDANYYVSAATQSKPVAYTSADTSPIVLSSPTAQSNISSGTYILIISGGILVLVALTLFIIYRRRMIPKI